MAIANEWVDCHAGAEKVFQALAQAFPTADLYALSAEPGVELDYGGRDLRTSALDRPLLRSRRKFTLPAMPAIWQGISNREYDLVITSSHAFARWFGPARDAYHISYTHTPMRYVWTPELDTRTRRLGRTIRVAGRPLQRLDLRSVTWTDSFVANSTEVQDRIRRFYGRDSQVIFPPVDITFFNSTVPTARQRGDYVIAYSRFIPYKRLDLAIQAASRVGIRLLVAGHGPEEARLRAYSQDLGADVEFRILPDNFELRQLVARARGLIFPGLEDFGIVPIEAQAAGTPVACLDRGGTRDTVIHGQTGITSETQTADGLTAALAKLLETRWDHASIAQHARAFGTQRFIDKIRGKVLAAGFDV